MRMEDLANKMTNKELVSYLHQYNASNCGRIFSEEAIQNMVEQFNKNIKEGKVLGELSHPDKLSYKAKEAYEKYYEEHCERCEYRLLNLCCKKLNACYKCKFYPELCELKVNMEKERLDNYIKKQQNNE